MKAKVKVLKGSELHFISVVHRDGSGTTNVENDDLSRLNNDNFTIVCLSISKGTYIASEFNSYVVKIKKYYKQNLDCIG